MLSKHNLEIHPLISHPQQDVCLFSERHYLVKDTQLTIGHEESTKMCHDIRQDKSVARQVHSYCTLRTQISFRALHVQRNIKNTLYQKKKGFHGFISFPDNTGKCITAARGYLSYIIVKKVFYAILSLLPQ